MKSTPVTLSAGATELARLVRRHGHVHVAGKVGASTSAVHDWLKGRRKPSGAARATLHAVFGIGPETWKRRPSTDAPAKAPRRTEAASAPPTLPTDIPAAPEALLAVAEGGDAVTMARRQLVAIEREIREARNGGASPRELAGLRASLSSAIKVFARCSGELAVTEAAILRSPAWARIVAAMKEWIAGVAEKRSAQEALGSLDRLMRAWEDEGRG